VRQATRSTPFAKALHPASCRSRLNSRGGVEFTGEGNSVSRRTDLTHSCAGLHQARPSQDSTSARVMLVPLTGLRAESIRE
jgi:hypothetical protein